jgi:hypothetical protein
MHKSLILFLTLFGVGWCQAQSLTPEVVATAGDHFATAGAQMSWTLGEPVIETYTSPTTQLTQGFHQTTLSIVAVNDPASDFQVRVYPNPTADRVNIEAQASSPAFGVAIFDAQGRALLIQSAAPQAPLRTLDLSGYAPGLYLLHLRSQDGQNIQAFKIIKQN